MAYKDDRSDSLQLIPNGVGFDDSTPQMSVEQLAEIFQGRISREACYTELTSGTKAPWKNTDAFWGIPPESTLANFIRRIQP